MRLLRILLLAVILPFGLSGQDIKIKEGTAKMGKTKLWCFNTRYDYDKKITRTTMEQILDETHLKRSSRNKGFSTYRGASWPAISSSKCDYYYKLRGRKGKTTIYLSVSKGYDNFVTSTNDPETATKISTFLTDLQAQIARAVLIQTKEAELQNMNKKNEAAKKTLKETEKEQAEKAKELKNLREAPRTAAPAVK